MEFGEQVLKRLAKPLIGTGLGLGLGVLVDQPLAGAAIGGLGGALLESTPLDNFPEKKITVIPEDSISKALRDTQKKNLAEEVYLGTEGWVPRVISDVESNMPKSENILSLENLLTYLNPKISAFTTGHLIGSHLTGKRSNPITFGDISHGASKGLSSPEYQRELNALTEDFLRRVKVE